MNDDSTLMEVTQREAFITNFKAVYNAMTAKPDCKSRVFNRNVIISLNDVYTLNDMIVDKFKSHYDNAGFSINVTVSFYGKDTIEFSSWQAFEAHHFYETQPINSITIVWEYFAKLPKYDVPQKHTLVVKLSDGLKPEEMLNLVFAGKLEDMKALDDQISPVVARVDFINSLLGEELLALVERWNKGLKNPTAQKNAIIRFLSKNRRKLAYVISYVSLAIICFAGIVLMLHYVEGFGIKSLLDVRMHLIEKSTYAGFGIIMGCVLLYKLVDFLTNVFFHMLEEDKTRHVFNINDGDIKRRDQIDGKYKKNVTRMFFSVAFTFVVDLICTVVINYILGQ